MIFKQPTYDRIDGKPAFASGDLNNFVREGSSARTARDTLDYFRTKAVKAGLQGLSVLVILWLPVPKA